MPIGRPSTAPNYDPADIEVIPGSIRAYIASLSPFGYTRHTTEEEIESYRRAQEEAEKLNKA